MQHFVGIRKYPQQYGGTEQLRLIAQCKHVCMGLLYGAHAYARTSNKYSTQTTEASSTSYS